VNLIVFLESEIFYALQQLDELKRRSFFLDLLAMLKEHDAQYLPANNSSNSLIQTMLISGRSQLCFRGFSGSMTFAIKSPWL
jgi:hypothetical protein